MPLDLAHDLEAALDGAVDLVTPRRCSIWCPTDWLERFATETAARRLPVYAALSYDGRVEFDPADPLDEKIVAAVNAHQRTDKGFGPALGPSAAQTAIERFEQLGYAVVQGPSDWVFQPGDQRDPDGDADRLGGRGARDRRSAAGGRGGLAEAAPRTGRGGPLDHPRRSRRFLRAPTATR